MFYARSAAGLGAQWVCTANDKVTVEVEADLDPLRR